ncbi:hypothetical protein CDAR_467491 [Caerostris darwini]|uniref:Uncharacterized protein n=1 Tax=Caerostris darwini TaxID=1538125 RepID=A0AAV4RQF9_9ARAC|nr:hypothetical protein CDAR_467491 [Caerostris darwini]
MQLHEMSQSKLQEMLVKYSLVEKRVISREGGITQGWGARSEGNIPNTKNCFSCREEMRRMSEPLIIKLVIFWKIELEPSVIEFDNTNQIVAFVMSKI